MGRTSLVQQRDRTDYKNRRRSRRTKSSGNLTREKSERIWMERRGKCPLGRMSDSNFVGEDRQRGPTKESGRPWCTWKLHVRKVRIVRGESVGSGVCYEKTQERNVGDLA